MNSPNTKFNNYDGMNDYFKASTSNSHNTTVSVYIPIWTNLIRKPHKPINEKLDQINENYNNRITTLESRVKILESENRNKDEKIEILTEIVVNMQKGINLIDGRTRSNNIIITEGNISCKDNDDNDIILQNDRDKSRHLLLLMRCDLFSDNDLERFEIERIGKRRDEYNHVVKVTLDSTQERNDFIKNSEVLKNHNDPWKSVFVKKKDLHPVYVAENKRIETKYVS